MTDRLSPTCVDEPTEERSGPTVEETADAVVITGSGYILNVQRQRPIAHLYLNGRHISQLLLASGADTIEGGPDEHTTLGELELSHDPGGVTLTWRGHSDLWRGKTVELQAWSDGFGFGYTLEGEASLDRAYMLRTRSVASEIHNVRLFNPEPNSGCVRYTGDRCSPTKNCIMCFPELRTETYTYEGPDDFVTISVGRDRYFHDGNWLFTPSPFCYAVEGAGNWLAMGIAAQPGEWMFSELEYPGGGFGFALVYNGHVQVNGTWRSPRLLCLTAGDEYSAIERYCDTLRADGLAPTHGRGPTQAWWYEPIFCAWGEQVSQELHAGGKGMAADFATQQNYERWLATLEAHDINPGTVVIDDKWQRSYGPNDIDTDKWPDLKGFIAGQHSKGRRVLLWLNAWSGQGLPEDECMLDDDGVSLRVDPGHPAFRERFTRQITDLLTEVDADGFKVDFTHLIPRGRNARSAGGLWGLELMRQWFELLSDAARQAKPDAMLMAHAANPYLADLIDVLRLNDIAGLADPFASVVPDMRHRAVIARAASPYWLLDADNWPCSSRPQWREYVRAQADGQLGVPSLYHAERLGWGPTDEPLDKEDYRTVRETWATYRAGLLQSRSVKREDESVKRET
ncbi:MAG: hypothetical protein ABI670_06630 [Chloroflexota bacterium]